MCVYVCMFMCECVYVCSFQDSLCYINMCCFKGQKQLPTLTHCVLNLPECTLTREFLLQCLALPDFSDDQHCVPQMDPSGARIQGVGVVLSEARVLRPGSGLQGSHADTLSPGEHSSGGYMPKSVWVFSFYLGPLWLNCSHKSSVNLYCDIWCVNRRGWFLTSKPQVRKEILSKMKI